MKSLEYYKQLIQHYGSATLIDVLHSPFVFSLYNNCIKKNSVVQLSRSAPTASGYFAGRVETTIEKVCVHKSYQVVFQPAEIRPDIPCMLVVDDRVSINALSTALNSAHNDTCLVKRNPHLNPSQATQWMELQSLPQATAIIDLFFVGFVFIRKEQRKQVFKLRLF